MIIPHDAFIDDRVSVCGLLANMELAVGALFERYAVAARFFLRKSTLPVDSLECR
jgi:hypothetical protein